MKQTLPKLYIKEGCPWCAAAIKWLDAKNFQYELIEVRHNKSAFDEMTALSGQTKTPTMQLSDGRVLADFDVEQLPEFLGL